MCISSYLIENGAVINAPDEYGNTPLHIAAREGKTSLVKLFASSATCKYVINKPNNQGITAIFSALSNHKFDTVHCLKELGATFDNCGICFLARNSNLVALNFLSDLSDDVLVEDELGNNALHWLAKEGDVVGIKALLETKIVDVGDRNDDGQTALHFAARYGNLRTVKLLIAHGIDILAKDKNSRTGLNLALTWRNVNIADYISQCLKQISPKDAD